MSELHRSILESARQTPIWADVDVLVVGGGTAGTAAAIAAARNGARTLLVEASGMLGGSQTAGLVTPMMPNHIDGHPLTQGICEELLSRHAALVHGPEIGGRDRLWFDPIRLAMAYDDAVAESGADVLYHSLCVDAVKKDDAVVGVVIESPSGRRALLARVVVDCTGDADVAAFAGVPFESGGPDGINQPMSLRFHMANVRLDEAAAFFTQKGWPVSPPLMSVGCHEAHESPIADIVTDAECSGVLEPGDLGYFQFFTMLGRPNEVSFNCPRLAGFNPTDVWELTRAAQVGRRKVRRIAQFCRQYIPGFQDAYISVVAPMLGVRESRRIIGEYVLTEEDVVGARKFPDAVARNCYPIDIHHPHGRGTTLRHLPPGEYHEIPYRCLVPKRVEGLLVAGRCISAAFAAQAAVRVQSNCIALGQAAGTAAALAVRLGIQPRQIDGAELRSMLSEQGAALL
ncbi:MAG: FAD-dependent oxidoreductase [Armatimonadota bacterium]